MAMGQRSQSLHLLNQLLRVLDDDDARLASEVSPFPLPSLDRQCDTDKNGEAGEDGQLSLNLDLAIQPRQKDDEVDHG